MDVTIYGTPSCPFCRRTKDFFKKNKIDFRDVNVADEKEGAREMIEKSGQFGVPVIDIDGTIIVGFDRGKIESALGL
jgi:glutaredoxin-like YruB-family protein